MRWIAVMEEGGKKKDMKKKKLVTLFLTMFMISAAVMGNSYIHAEDAGVQEVQKEETQETGKEAADAITTPGQDEALTSGTKVKDIVEKAEKAEEAAEKEIGKPDEAQQPAGKAASRLATNGMVRADNLWEDWHISSYPTDIYHIDYANSELVIDKPGKIYVEGQNNRVMNTIRIAAEGDVEMELANVNIESGKSPIAMNGNGNVILSIYGNNELETWDNDAAVIQVGIETTLFIQGDGTLNATAKLGAAIGGSRGSYNGEVLIDSGTIIADSVCGAAIGGGQNGISKTVEIAGGNITARSNYGAGIGSGHLESGLSDEAVIQDIIIKGGTIDAESFYGAGIGSGQNASAPQIEISGGTITAVSEHNGRGTGAGIGGGEALKSMDLTVGNILITGGNITATGEAGAGIGGGRQGVVTEVKITGGTIDASSSLGGLDIGGGENGNIGAFWIDGGSVNIVNNKIPGQPRNNRTEMDMVYCGKLTGQVSGKTKMIKVDDVDYKIDGDHKQSPTNFYLYMTAKDHIISVIDTDDKVSYYEADWDGSQFTISNDRIAGDFIVEGGTKGTDWYYDSVNNCLSISKGGGYSVRSLIRETTQYIYINETAKGTGAVNLTINNLRIESNEASIRSASDIRLNVTLVGDTILNTSKSTKGASCLHVAKTSTLEVSGSGTLSCTAKDGAGIGGYAGESGGEITIRSGKINSSSVNGAGIGGGNASYGEKLHLLGGTITAQSTNGDGVGSGAGGTEPSRNIFIDKASVWATGKKAISITPLAPSSNTELARYELKNQTSASNVSVDGTAYLLSGAHPGSSSYYLYLPKEEHTVAADKTYTIKWYESAGQFKLKSPTPAGASTATSTQSSITVTPPPGMDTATYGAAEYSIDQVNWQSGATFNNLKADQSNTVYVRYSGTGDYGASDPVSTTIKTAPAAYTITIPSTLTAGGDAQSIAVNTNETFALGYGGRVDIKVTAGMTNNGVMTLIKSSDAVTTQFKVNGSNFTDTDKNVASFQKAGDTAVSISFTQPTYSGDKIPAGSYSGKVTFGITYAD